MAAGHLKEQDGYYYMVISYKEEATGKRKTKTIATGLKKKGNKKRAEELLRETKENFVPEPVKKVVEPEIVPDFSTMLFSDFIIDWLKMIRSSVEITTYANYSRVVMKNIVPYFSVRKITLHDLKAKHIQDYYQYCLDELKMSPNTVIRHHANIRKSLQYAFVTDLIPCNPADKVQRPRKSDFVGSTYNASELEQLFNVFKGNPMEDVVLLGAFYGLRREEVLGLKWSAVDFDEKTILINHTVTQINIDGQVITTARDKTKTKSSTRTLPLVPPIEDMLRNLQKKQAEYRKLCGSCYSREFLDYICLDPLGKRITPDFVTQHFRMTLKKYGLRHIRFHDLRHSCASLLYKNGVNLKEIQDWLGHSDISTTANIYTHMDFTSKVASANAIVDALHF